MLRQVLDDRVSACHRATVSKTSVTNHLLIVTLFVTNLVFCFLSKHLPELEVRPRLEDGADRDRGEGQRRLQAVDRPDDVAGCRLVQERVGKAQ